MTEQLFVRLSTDALAPETDLMVEWGLFQHRALIAGSRKTPLSELKSHLPELYSLQPFVNVTVLVPTEAVTLLEADIPGSQNKHLIKALPYALEEQLADDIEELHFALLAKKSVSPVPVAVINKTLLSGWVEMLKTAGLNPVEMLPDALCIPWQAGTWQLVYERNRTLMRVGPYRALTFPGTQMPVFLDAVFDNTQHDEQGVQLKLINEKTDKVAGRVLDALKSEIEAASVEVPIRVERQHIVSTAFEIMCLTAQNAKIEKNLPNLMQGVFKQEIKSAASAVKWRPCAALFAAWFVVQIGFFVTQGIYFGSQAQTLEAGSIELFRQLFPEEKRIVNVRRQMEAKLKQASGGDSQRAFMPLLGMVGEQVNTIGKDQKADIEIRRITFDQQIGSLKVEMVVADFPIVDQLKARIESAGGKVSIDAATKDSDNKVKARLQISV